LELIYAILIDTVSSRVFAKKTTNESWRFDYALQELERMRTLMKEEEKRQREHDAAIEVLRRYVSLGMIASNILCYIMISIFFVSILFTIL
jgi:hypothetical protein